MGLKGEYCLRRTTLIPDAATPSLLHINCSLSRRRPRRRRTLQQATRPGLDEDKKSTPQKVSLSVMSGWWARLPHSPAPHRLQMGSRCLFLLHLPLPTSVCDLHQGTSGPGMLSSLIPLPPTPYPYFYSFSASPSPSQRRDGGPRDQSKYL